MDNYDKLNEDIKNFSFLDQIAIVATELAGRDALIHPAPPELKEAVIKFKDEIYNAIANELTFFESLTCIKKIKQKYFDRCYLQINPYGKVKLFYNDKIIHMIDFNYKSQDLCKEELKRIFNYAKENKMDICVEVTIPGQDDTEFIINSTKSLDNKLDYYLKNYDDNLCLKRNKDVKILDVLPLNFITSEENKKDN